jgi:UDP-N-acetyl-D-mannosaminuronic acid transferase (WecB/TagA/CpsF family)
VYQVLKRSDDKNDVERAEKFRGQMNEAVKYSILMSSEKITIARAEKEIREMIGKADNNPPANMSVLYNKYGFLCMDVMENPFKRLKQWLDMK